jgi:hypothetical protein
MEDVHLELKLAQANFLSSGGVLQMALTKKYKTGELSRVYEFQEYPKALNIPLGEEEVECSTEVGNGSVKKHWTETRQIIADLVVHDRAEEAATLAAIERADDLGIEIGRDWTAPRLRDAVAQAERAATQPRSIEDRKAARIEALRRELAALVADEAEGAANPESSDVDPLRFTAPPTLRRPHRRTRFPSPLDLIEAPPEPSTDQAA